MEIKWGLPLEPAVAVVTKDGDTTKSSSSNLFSSAIAVMSSTELVAEKLFVAADPSGAETTSGSTPVHDDICVAVWGVVNRGGVNSLQVPVQPTISVLTATVSDVAVASTGTALVTAAGSSSVVVPLVTISDVVPAAATNAKEAVTGPDLIAMASSNDRIVPSDINIVLPTYCSTKCSDHITGDYLMEVSMSLTSLLL